MKTTVCKQQPWPEKTNSPCVCVVSWCVWKALNVSFKADSMKQGEEKNKYPSIFSVLCHRLNFCIISSLAFAWLCAPIDWQLAPEPLRPLKIPGRGFRFLAPASGPTIVCVWKAGSNRAQPSHSHSDCLLCVPLPQLLLCYPQGPG